MRQLKQGTMKIKNAMAYTTDHKFTKADIYITGERITGITPCKEDVVEDKKDTEAVNEMDATGLYAIPGLVDIHLHGAAGYDVCHADEKELERIAEYEACHGILAICPTTMSYSEEILGKIIDKTRKYVDKPHHGADIVGLHMEGPFISPERAGAQNPAYIMPPDIQMFGRLQERSHGLIRLLDMAPEMDGALEFIESCRDIVRISLAHTGCTYEIAKEAFALGASHITHLYNGMPDIGHREPGPIPAAVEAKAMAEIIADGIHNHPAAVRMAFGLFGVDRMILISDSMEATGLPDGKYRLGGQSVTVQGKKAVLSEHPETIAGSVTNLYDCMVNCVQKMQIPLEDAVRAATENPAKAIGVDAEYGKVAPGYYANLVLMDEKMRIQKVVQKGTVLAYWS